MSSLLDALLPMPAPELVWPSVFPEHLSASSLNRLQKCPEQWRRRYLNHERDRKSGALIWGGADHYAHEVNFRQKIETHEDLPLEDVKQAFSEGFDREVEEGGGVNEVSWGEDTFGALKDAGILLAAAYHTQVSPTVQPIAVEQQFEIIVPGVPVPVIGYVDVKQESGSIERKTAKAKTVVAKPSWRIQGLIYQLVDPDPVDYHVSVKTKTPTIYTPATDPGLRLMDSRAELTQRLVLNLATQLVSLLETYGPDDPWPGAITHDWACGWCPFGPKSANDCAWWA